MGKKWDAFKSWLKGEEPKPKDHGPTREWDAFMASVKATEEAEKESEVEGEWPDSRDEQPSDDMTAPAAGLPGVKYALSGFWKYPNGIHRNEVRLYDRAESLEFARRQLSTWDGKRYWRGDIVWTEVDV